MANAAAAVALDGDPLPRANPEEVGLSAERLGEIAEGRSEGGSRRGVRAHSPGPIRWHYRQVINALVYQAIVD